MAIEHYILCVGITWNNHGKFKMKLVTFLKRTGLLVVCLVFLYGVFGFLGLPIIVKYQLEKQVSILMQRQVSVGEIRINPFALSIQLDDFSIKSENKPALMTWESLFINFQSSSLFNWALTFDEISLDGPAFYFEQQSPGKFNFSDLLTEDKAPVAKSEVESPLIPLIIHHLYVKKGNVKFNDKHANAKLEFIPISFSLDDFSTLLSSQEINQYQFKANDSKGGELSCSGSFKLSPFFSKGEIRGKGLVLATFVDFVQKELGFTMPSGMLGFKTAYQLFAKPDFGVVLSNGTYTFDNINIQDKLTKNVLLTIPKFGLSSVMVDTVKQQAKIGQIQLSSMGSNLVLHADGSMNIDAALDFSAFSTQATKPVEKRPNKSEWLWQVDEFLASNLSLSIEDKTHAEPMRLDLSDFQIKVEQILSNSRDPFRASISGKLNENGQISLLGEGKLAPLQLNANLALQEIALSTIQPYLSTFMHVNLKDGDLGADMTINAAMNDAGVLSQFSIKGKANVAKLKIVETINDQALLGWQDLQLNGIDLAVLEKSAKIDNIEFINPNVRFLIQEDGSTNIDALFVEKQIAQKPKIPPTSNNDTEQLLALSPSSEITQTVNPSPSLSPSLSPSPNSPAEIDDSLKNDKEEDFSFKIGTINLKSTQLFFSDLSLEPDFVVEINDLSGDITGISSSRDQVSVVDLLGKVDRFAPVKISGSFNVLIDNPVLDIGLAFRNMELTTLTPYSGTYAGYKIEQGQMNLDLNYVLKNKNLHGENKIVISQLQLGDKVESEKAVNLPLKLAIALLSDKDGVIDLNLVVEGNVGAPEFSVAGIFWTVLQNTIVKAAMAPFNILAKFAGGGEDLDKVEFSPGSVILSLKQKEKLHQLAKALKQRPRLSLNVRGNVHYVEDSSQLREQLFKEIILKTAGIQNGMDVNFNTDNRVRAALFKLYNGQSGRNWEKLQKNIELKYAKTQPQPATDKIMELTAEKVYATLLMEQKVTDDAIYKIAMLRAQSVKSNLVETHGISAGRIFVLAAKVDPTQKNAVANITLGHKSAANSLAQLTHTTEKPSISLNNQHSVTVALPKKIIVSEFPTVKDISEIQTLLSNHGLKPGPIDGKVGRKTLSAIKQYQHANNLAEDGKISQALLQHLQGRQDSSGL